MEEVIDMMRSSVCRSWRGTIALCCLLALMAGPGAAQVVLELDAEKTEFLVDEPIFVTVAVRNVADVDVPILRLLEPGSGVLRFEIVAPGEEPRAYRPCAEASFTQEALEESVIWLAPGEAYSAAADLTEELREVPGRTEWQVAILLSVPGEYGIRASYCIPEDWPTGPLAVWSNEVYLLVSEPEGVDLAAHEILQAGSETGEKTLWNASSGQALYYEAVLGEYPESQYAIYARLFLGGTRHLDGVWRMRGTTEGVAALEAAATLYLTAAEQARDTPFGVRATMGAAMCSANLGDVVSAEALLEEVFLSPAATDADRVQVLLWLDRLESGSFERAAGLTCASTSPEPAVPLRSFAEALGFSVDWGSTTKTVAVSGRKLHSTISPGQNVMLVNGTPRTGVRTRLRDARTEVSPSVIATLMAEHYGKGMATAFPQRIAKAPGATQP